MGKHPHAVDEIEDPTGMRYNNEKVHYKLLCMFAEIGENVYLQYGSIEN